MAPSPTSVRPSTSSSAGRHTRGPVVKTSPRFASRTGTAPANASSVDAPASGTPSAAARERAVARPMRTLVKLPGPRPATMRPTSAGSPTSSSTAARSSPALARRARAPVESAQTAPKLVAVSNARIVFTRDGDAPVRRVDVAEGNARPGSREPAAGVLGPFDERDRAVEVRLEVAPLGGVDPRQPVEIEVRDGRRGLVAVADRERGARNRPGDPEGAGGAPDEGRLAGAELAGDGDHVARPEPHRQARGERLGLLRRGGDRLHPGNGV